MGSDEKTLFDFRNNENSLIKELRTHCLDNKRTFQLLGSQTSSDRVLIESSPDIK